MSKPTLCITGATGNVGLETLRFLSSRYAGEFHLVAAVTSPSNAQSAIGLNNVEYRRFDMTDPGTFANPTAGVFAGVERMLLVRPPQISDVPRYIAPIIIAAKQAGVRHVVFLSLQGVESNTRTPHYDIEQLLRASGMEWTFLRPAFFMQNLSTTHAREIATRNEIFVPAGNGKTNFIDAVDIGETAARVLAAPQRHVYAAYDLTGKSSLTYNEIATILSRELGRTITYTNPSEIRFFWRTWRGGASFTFTLIMIYLYNRTKSGAADVYAPDLEKLLAREPHIFEEFAHTNRAVWLR